MSAKGNIVLTMAVYAVLTSSALGEYWYGVNDTVPLEIDSLKVTVKLDGGFSSNQVLGPIDRIVAVVEL